MSVTPPPRSGWATALRLSLSVFLLVVAAAATTGVGWRVWVALPVGWLAVASFLVAMDARAVGRVAPPAPPSRRRPSPPFTDEEGRKWN